MSLRDQDYLLSGEHTEYSNLGRITTAERHRQTIQNLVMIWSQNNPKAHEDVGDHQGAVPASNPPPAHVRQQDSPDEVSGSIAWNEWLVELSSLKGDRPMFARWHSTAREPATRHSDERDVGRSDPRTH